MNKKRIYLAGTIYEEEPGKTWKQRLVQHLTDSGFDSRFEVFDPDPSMECDITMVPRDKAEIDNCDIFIAYMEYPTVGTSMEIYHAYLKNNTPIALICPNFFCHGNIWLEAHVHIILQSVEDCVKWIKTLRY
jgi:nucleoside 2-deoxyribosyltransferase